MERTKILVVDDELEVREFFRDFLETEGYAVVVASSGHEALTAVEFHRPDLVLLDIMMPGMSGLETLHRLRAANPTIGIIMLTAVHDQEIAKEAIDNGANDYITKPVDLKYLKFAILTQVVHRRSLA